MSERSLTGTFYDFPGESSRSAVTTGIRHSPDFAPLGGLPATASAFAFTVRTWLRSAPPIKADWQTRPCPEPDGGRG